LRGAELRKRLIHEMAHAAANIGHGKLWKDEMHRLRRLGATREDPDAFGDPAQMVSRSKSRRAVVRRGRANGYALECRACTDRTHLWVNR